MKTILVTGGAGFIGSHLVEALLAKGNRVVVVDNFHEFYDYKIKVNNLLLATGNEANLTCIDLEKDVHNLQLVTKTDRFELYFKDIRDLNALDEIFSTHKIDCVVHLAALAGVRPSIENPLEYQSVNVEGSQKLWEFCKKFKVTKFVCASSSSVYGNNTKMPFEETDPVDLPISPYAATKKSAEVLGHVYHHLYGIDMIQLRFFTVYGPRQRPDLAIHKFTRLISEGKKLPFYGDGTTARDYTYITDIIDGVLKSIDYVMANDKVYEILNLGESEVICLTEMLAVIEEALGKKANLNKMPMQPGDVRLTNANIDKAKRLIGYQPKTKFKEGVKSFVDWYQLKK